MFTRVSGLLALTLLLAGCTSQGGIENDTEAITLAATIVAIVISVCVTIVLVNRNNNR